MDMRIFLIGFMGSGKSYVGRQLADILHWPFYDLDSLIEQQEQAAVRTIFEQKGEAHFRQIEREVLHTTAIYPKAIIACGGGTPCFFDNMGWMKAHGLAIYLRAPAEVLYCRLSKQQEQRPLLKGMDGPGLLAFIANKLAEREPFYQQANIVYQQRTGEEPVAQELVAHFQDIIGH
ncbi:MAG: shikimate kinase [Phaeodactylibacter sp.]|nr:shikimate kinase [Phaeodactylibacter sp.]